jgi:hypothetical protein
MSIMGHRSLFLMNEKKCEPQLFFPLKNSDELLWEDQTPKLNDVALA